MGKEIVEEKGWVVQSRPGVIRTTWRKTLSSSRVYWRRCLGLEERFSFFDQETRGESSKILSRSIVVFVKQKTEATDATVRGQHRLVEKMAVNDAIRFRFEIASNSLSGMNLLDVKISEVEWPSIDTAHLLT